MTELDLSFVDQTVERLGKNPEAVIPILQAIQNHYRYLPQPALERICRITRITPASIAGVSTFYTQFRHKPVGQHLISVCHGTACHVKGAQLVQESLERKLGIPIGDDTDPSGRFTVQKVACLGCCTLAPVVQIDEITYGHLTPSGVGKMLDDFAKHAKSPPAKTPHPAAPAGAQRGEIRIGLGSCCISQGSGRVRQAVDDMLRETGAAATVKRVGCVGMCHQTPLVELIEPGKSPVLYAKVDADRARAIVLRHFQPAGWARRIRNSISTFLDRWAGGELAAPPEKYSLDVRESPVCNFLGRQQRLATEQSGEIDPTDLDEYVRHDGFQALRSCLETSANPQTIVDDIAKSGLRGRGGAGFLTGFKWQKVREAAGDVKYVICNGDEGDPGAFMDRMLLESFPYRVIEGMAIAAYAVGAHQGVFYIRAEYPLAVERIREAIEVCHRRNFLGKDLFGSGFDFDVTIMEGAGAFVCGEETALLASIEGRRGMPRLRPPYPAESGLHGKPTLVNNVETYALVPWILRHGAGAFAALGTAKSKGTKVFALAGKIQRGGLIEVPMGVTIRQIVEEIGGGVLPGRTFKAVQVGGPSGGCIPASLADTPVDYEAIVSAGAIMGSGGLVVLDDRDCMVDIARFFLRFTQDQSCGRCTFCRVGTRRMLDILDRICTGKGRARDLDELDSLAHSIRTGSLCGLGKTAPNPVLSTIRYFREEYEQHLAGKCPAGKCKDLIQYRITNDCIGCTRCAQQCPVGAIAMTPYVRHRVDSAKCTRCDACREVCPRGAVVVE